MTVSVFASSGRRHLFLRMQAVSITVEMKSNWIGQICVGWPEGPIFSSIQCAHLLVFSEPEACHLRKSDRFNEMVFSQRTDKIAKHILRENRCIGRNDR